MRWLLLLLLTAVPASADLFDQPPPFFAPLVKQTPPPFIPISIDGTPQTVPNTNLTTMSVTYSTTNGNEIVLVSGYCLLGSMSVSDVAGLIWTNRAKYHPGLVDDLESWFAYAPVPLVADVITVTCSQDIVNAMSVVAIAGLAVGAPYDSNASLPAFNTGTQTSSTISVFPSTSHAHDLLLCIYGTGITNPPACATGFTDMGSVSNIGVSYKIVTTVQTNVNITTGTGFVNGLIGDAMRGN